MTYIPRPIIMEDIDVAYLDALWLADDGRIKLLPAAAFREIDPMHLRLWMHHQARYCLPTLELVTWLREQIGDRTAVELGSGNGDLYYHLGITGTDSYIQTTPEFLQMTALWAQPSTKPRRDTLRLNAETAVRNLSPDLAVACYLTRKFIPGKDRIGKAQAFIWGPREEKIIERVQCYIHVGNEHTHGQKTALKKRHRKIRLPGLVTRGDPALDIIYVWGS